MELLYNQISVIRNLMKYTFFKGDLIATTLIYHMNSISKKIIRFTFGFVCLFSLQIINAQCWKTVSAGDNHTLAIDGNNGLWAWGANNFGQLGNGTTVESLVPIPIDTLNSYLSISAGIFHSHAIKADGTLWSWGRNTFGALGDGTELNRTSPVQIGTDTLWKYVNGSRFHTVGIKVDSTIWAWGNNGNAQLGNGTQSGSQTLIPEQVGTDRNWKEISAGDNHSIAIKFDGTVWVWGSNVFGALGSGLSIQTSPIQVGIDSSWSKVSAGENHNLLIKSDGTLWAWGRNFSGLLGTGTTSDIISPTQIGESSNWASLSTEVWHSAVINDEGQLFVFGSNQSGQLGNGNNNENYLISDPLEGSWVSVTTGFLHTIGVKSDGTLWSWGNNSNGNLGDGTTLPRNIPVNIVCGINCSTIVMDEISSCGSYTWIDGNTYSTNNNTAVLSIPSIFGCDTLLTLNLTITEIDTSVLINQNTLIANQGDAIYQWLDCNNNNEPIQNETSQSITSLLDGNFAVSITSEGCTEVSDCYTITISSLNNTEFSNKPFIYPNPSNNYLEIKNLPYSSMIKLIDITGKLLFNRFVVNENNTTITTTDFMNGFYILQIEHDGIIINEKILVEH